MKKGQLYLTGFMGTGKSTVARCLCRYYNMKQIEMDRQIEVEEGMKISQIFKEKGEAYGSTCLLPFRHARKGKVQGLHHVPEALSD